MSTHTLIVTAVPLTEQDLATLTPTEQAEYQANPDKSYEVRCSGVDSGCNTWESCGCEVSDYELDAEADDTDTLDYASDAVCKKDGEQHRMFSWGLTTPVGRCFVATHPGLDEAAGDLGLAPGEYPVDFDVPNETDLWLSVIPAEQPA